MTSKNMKDDVKNTGILINSIGICNSIVTNYIILEFFYESKLKKKR